MDTSIPTADVLIAQARFVSALARDLLSDAHAAEDLAQETWLRFLRRPPRAGAATRGWLRSVTSRLAVEGLRGRSRRAAREERVARGEALPSVEEELAHTEILRSVAEAVLALDEPYRSTVLLAYWRGWDARRIARETATPLATVRSRLQRAHQTLRERLDRRHGREAWALALSSLPTAQASSALAVGALVVVGVLTAGLFLLRAAAQRREPLEVVPAVAAAPQPAREETQLAQQAGPAPAVRSELGAAPAVLRVAGTVADLACAELALPARPSSGLQLTVRLDDREHAPARAPLAEVTTQTDAEGRFAVELARPAVEGVFVRVSAEQDAGYRRLWYRSALAQAPTELALTRAPHGVLHGSVLDERGAPLAGIGLDLALDGGEVSVRSADDGAFAVPNAQRLRGVKLHASPLALLGWEGARSLDEGGFTPLAVRLGPAARLRLEVNDKSDAGIAGVRVRVSLPECEQAAIGMNADERTVSGATDDGGAVHLDGLWAGRKLRLGLDLGNESFTSESMEGGRLRLAAQGSAGRPIVIDSGTELALEARLDVERDVAGVVRLPDGAPAAKARVEITDLGRGNAWRRPKLLELASDERGRFAGRLRTAELVGPLRVTASAPELAPKPAESNVVRGLGYAGARPVPDVDALEMPAARVELAPGDAETLASLELVLASRHAIRGTVLGRDGVPVARLGMGGSRVWAAPAGSAYHGHGAQASAIKDRPGAFEIAGLEPGRYDVFVSEELEGFYTFENFLHRFPALEPGASPVELRLPERREVRIRVRLAGGEPSGAIVLHRKLFPFGAVDAPRAEAVERVSGAQGWPEETALRFTGIGGSATELGQTSDGLDGFDGREHTLQPLEPGYYVIGVHADGPEGEPEYFPQATRLLRFEEGEHVVEFELLPAATLRGRVVADAAGEFLAVALVDEHGSPMTLAPLDGFTHAVRIVDTSASGEFVLHCAPAGSFRLRAGSRAELERGEFRIELPLTLVPGENARVDVRL